MNRRIDERYLDDAVFAKAVKIIENLMNEETGLTPLDIRDAAYLARVRFEMMRPYPILMSEELSERIRRNL